MSLPPRPNASTTRSMARASSTRTAPRGVFVPLTPVDTAPAEGTPASPAAAGTRDARIAPAWPLSLRVKPVTSEHAMVVTSHPLASDVGVDILRRGGNAVDAAVAIGFALAVVHPVAGNIGGGGFMVVRTHDGVVRTLDFREAAPSGATRSMYVDSAGNVRQSSLTGHLSVGVPGTVAGLFEAHRQLGHVPWQGFVAPARRLGPEGPTLDRVRRRPIGREGER